MIQMGRNSVRLRKNCVGVELGSLYKELRRTGGDDVADEGVVSMKGR